MSAADLHLHLHLNRGAKNNEEWEEWLLVGPLVSVVWNTLTELSINVSYFIIANEITETIQSFFH